MKILSVAKAARRFSEVIDFIEQEQDEVVLVRNQRRVARLIPEIAPQTALEVFGDLYRTFNNETAQALSSAVASNKKKRRGHISELRNPWAD